MQKHAFSILKQGLCVLAGLTFAGGFSPQIIAGPSEDLFAAQLAERASKLEADLIGPAFTAEFAEMTEMPDEGLIERFAPFRHHANNASRLDFKRQTVAPPEDAITLSPDTLTTIKRVLKTPEHLSGNSLRTTLLVRMPREKAWRALEAMEIGKQFDAAAGLASLLMSTESNTSKRELLALIAARNAFLNAEAGPGDETSIQLASVAAASEDEVIAHHADLWIEAISNPASMESLNLAFQIWELVTFEQNFRDQAAALSGHLARSLEPVLATVQVSQLSTESKEAQIARIASIGAEMGFQHTDAARIAWARNLSAELTHGNPEDLLAPDYYQAYDLYARGRSLEATAAAESLFLSGIECDIAADAGRILAESLMRLDDDLAALATYRLLRELYPNQTYVHEQIEIRETHLTKKFESEINVVDAKVEERYGEQRRKILASREQNRNQEQAGLKPAEKKVASTK